MPFRWSSVTLLALALAVAGCTPAGTSDPTSAPTAAPSPGPLAVDPDRPDGSSSLPSPTVFQVVVDDAGTPAVVYQDPDAPDSLTATRIAVGPDLAAWSPVTPTDVESGLDLGTLVVGADGSVNGLALLNGPGDAFGLHVLRVAADGTQTVTKVSDARIGSLGYRTAEAVSDDGRTAVVATADPAADDPTVDDPAAVDRIEVLTVDLATAAVTARTTADLGTDSAPDLLDVAVAADGAVSVLTGQDADLADTRGAALARFAPGLAYTGSVVLDATARFQSALVDLTPDGTAVVSLEPDLASGQLSTTVLTVAPGSTEVTPVADLAGIGVRGLVTGPDGWVQLTATDYSGRAVPELLPLELASGRTADPVELCPDGQPFDVVRSGDGSTLLVHAACGPGDTRLFVLR